MLLRLKEILFNHNSSSACTDAFNIRKNEQDFLELPEWRGVSINPKDSPAAYALCETQGKTLTIQANFTFDGPDKQDVCIRALDANFHREEPFGTNLSKLELQLLQNLVPNAAGNVLGQVKATPITLSTGETGFKSFDLEHVRIWDAGVGVHDIVWRWQYRVSGTNDWIDLAVTTHRIYTVIQIPKRPWSQDHKPSNTQLPWIEVLEHACDWASGAQNTDDAAERITRRVDELGQAKVICYAQPPSYTDTVAFDCSSFLELLCNGCGKGNSVNCDDCAAIVSTFANSIGCDLEQMCIRAIGEVFFRTKPHTRIGINGIQKGKPFYHHLVAAEGGCGKHVEVFDACLKIGDSNPTEPSVFTLATNLPFIMGESGYHFRLVAPQDQSITQPHPLCKRRRLGPATGFDETCTDRVLLEKHFDFSSWKESDAPGTKVFVWEFFWAHYILSSLQLVRLEESDPCSIPKSIHSLWRGAAYAEGTLFRIDLYETVSWQDARQALMTILTSLHGPGIVRQETVGIGDVTFADPCFEELLFAIGNLVFFVRNVRCEKGSLVSLGREIAEKILNPPPGIIEHPVNPNIVRRFSFASSEGAIGIKVKVREEPAHPLAPRRLYQFIADKGEVSLEDGNLMYKPKSAGDHTLKIFAADAQGNAVLQALPLKVR